MKGIWFVSEISLTCSFQSMLVIRLEEKVNLLESQLEIDRKENERLIKQEQEFFEKEADRLKAEHATMMNSLLDRNAAQSKEIQKLHDLILVLRAELTKQKAELEST